MADLLSQLGKIPTATKKSKSTSGTVKNKYAAIDASNKNPNLNNTLLIFAVVAKARSVINGMNAILDSAVSRMTDSKKTFTLSDYSDFIGQFTAGPVALHSDATRGVEVATHNQANLQKHYSFKVAESQAALNAWHSAGAKPVKRDVFANLIKLANTPTDKQTAAEKSQFSSIMANASIASSERDSVFRDNVAVASDVVNAVYENGITSDTLATLLEFATVRRKGDDDETPAAAETATAS